jgi:hypothetical protein
VKITLFSNKVVHDCEGVENVGDGVAEYGDSAQTLTPYPADLNHCQNCTPASEDGLKESPKHATQK